jgi:hypothetical protein
VQFEAELLQVRHFLWQRLQVFPGFCMKKLRFSSSESEFW